jgi:hypothetical protein
MPSTPFRRRWLVAIAAMALVATGGLAYAAIPDSGGVIHTCYTKSSGAWRVIDTDTGQSCKSNEAALDLYSKAGADLAFLAKTGTAADSDKLDGQDSTAFLGATAKAADSDTLDGQDSSAFLGSGAKAADSDKLDGKDSAEFLGVGATAADSAKLGGVRASAYIRGVGGVLLVEAGNISDGGTSSFTCCAEVGQSPPMTLTLECDTSGNTTLVASSPFSFRWWSEGAFGNATPASSGFEADFAIANGAKRTSVRTTSGSLTTTFDLDTSIGATCNFGWTFLQAYPPTPGP